MNKPYSKKQMEALSVGYTPTQFPNRRARRQQIKRGKKVQIVEFNIASHKYNDRDKILQVVEGMYNGAKAIFYRVRRLIYHFK